MYTIFICIFLFASFAMMVREGLWNNLINVFSIVVAGLAAFGLHQPLVVLLDEQTGGSYTYLLDFIVLWLVFALAVGLLKQLANLISRHRVAFPGPIDNGGGAFVGFLGALAMTGFAMATFHAAPLNRDMMGGGYYYGDTLKETASGMDDASALFRPDLAWLRFTNMMLGTSRLGQAGDPSAPIKFDGFSSPVFVQQHSQHRARFEKLDVTAVKRK